ncbi:MAG: hypothetical protein PVG39_02250 [Desulfobacteraceae bacterium]
MKCPLCNYEWRARVDNPKECPKCKRYLPQFKKQFEPLLFQREEPKPSDPERDFKPIQCI